MLSKTQRKIRTRARIRRAGGRPRLTVFRSLGRIYAQIIDDAGSKTLAQASDHDFKGEKMSRVEKAKKVGELIAERAKEKKIEQVVFDRGAYKYHGRVKALAEGAREKGLKF